MKGKRNNAVEWDRCRRTGFGLFTCWLIGSLCSVPPVPLGTCTGQRVIEQTADGDYLYPWSGRCAVDVAFDININSNANDDYSIVLLLTLEA